MVLRQFYAKRIRVPHMPTIRKRGKRWRAEVAKNGVRKSGSFSTKREAQEWAYEVEDNIDDLKSGIHYLHEAIIRYSDEESPKHKGKRWEQIKLNKLLSEIPDRPLSELASDDVVKWRNERLKHVSESSVRREMGIFNQVLNTAVKEWGWLAVNPSEGVKRPQEHRARQRLISQKEINAITLNLGFTMETDVTMKKQEIAIIFLIAIETAMRSGEIISLTWSQVNLKKRVVSLDKTKNGDKRDVPLSSYAVKLFKKIPTKKGACFTVAGNSFSTMFRKARDKAKIKDLHFHDSRAEALTRLSKKLDILELARMVGHRDPRSLMIYYRETAEEIAKKLD